MYSYSATEPVHSASRMAVVYNASDFSLKPVSFVSNVQAMPSD